MKLVIFYEKPGCATNARQKRSLRTAGFTVIERDLLRHGMQAEELRAFFGALPVAAWFNPNAPKVKSGEIDPASLDADGALGLLMGDPVLIRRPLMVLEGRKVCGFDVSLPEAESRNAEACSGETPCNAHTGKER